MRVLVRTGTMAMVLVAAMFLAPVVLARGHRSRAAVIHLKWRRIALPPHCGADMLGVPWVLCSGGFRAGISNDTYELYDVRQRIFKQVTVPAGSKVVGVGAGWLELTTLNCDVGRPGEDCTFEFGFENIGTGQQRSLDYAPGGSAIPDLDALGLSRTLCSPIEVGEGLVAAGYGPPAAGLVLAGGQFAVVEQATQSSGTGGPVAYDYLERCGSHLHKLITTGVDLPSSPHGVTMDARAVVLGDSGFFLPSLRRFVIKPRRANFAALELTGRKLYALSGEGRLLAARFPVQVPALNGIPSRSGAACGAVSRSRQPGAFEAGIPATLRKSGLSHSGCS